VNILAVEDRGPGEDAASKPASRTWSKSGQIQNAEPIDASWPSRRAHRTTSSLARTESMRRQASTAPPEDPETPPPLVETPAGLEARAQAVLDSVRNIARGIYPSLLADFGLAEALRAQAVRAAVDVRLIGSVPRRTGAAEEAVYLACSEAIQNAAKSAGRGTRVALRLHYDRGSLAVRVADDGRGFDPAHTPRGAGLQNIRDRIEDLGGTFNLASRPGHGTAVIISLPWPAPADRRR
jgi:signal transduction histidine kinase